jgi:hypothetical protein
MLIHYINRLIVGSHAVFFKRERGHVISHIVS